MPTLAGNVLYPLNLSALGPVFTSLDRMQARHPPRSISLGVPISSPALLMNSRHGYRFKTKASNSWSVPIMTCCRNKAVTVRHRRPPAWDLAAIWLPSGIPSGDDCIQAIVADLARKPPQLQPKQPRCSTSVSNHSSPTSR